MTFPFAIVKTRFIHKFLESTGIKANVSVRCKPEFIEKCGGLQRDKTHAGQSPANPQSNQPQNPINTWPSSILKEVRDRASEPVAEQFQGLQGDVLIPPVRAGTGSNHPSLLP
jgi:hypothetical protein